MVYNVLSYKLPHPPPSGPVAWRHGLLTFDAVSVLVTSSLITVAWQLAMLYLLPEFWRFIVPLIVLSILSMADWLRPPRPTSFCLSYWCNMLACFIIFLSSALLIAAALSVCDGTYRFYIGRFFASKMPGQGLNPTVMQLVVKMARAFLLYIALLQMIVSYVCLAAYQSVRRQAYSELPR